MQIFRKALAEQPRRFPVVIDDIDRLSPDEALLIFRLVKSAGRLPNVMYLLVYDRQLAEKIVSETFRRAPTTWRRSSKRHSSYQSR